MKQIKRYLKKQVRRNERRMTTKKAKRAQAYIAITILTLLALNQVIGIARAAMEPKILTFENKPLDWDVRGSQENTEPVSEGTDQSGALVGGGIEEKIKKAFPEAPHVALAIAKSESGLKPVKGDLHIQYEHDGKTIGHSCGIFQIRVLPGRPTCEELMDEDTNIKWARKLYDAKLKNGEKQGFLPWSNYKNERYKSFL